MQGRDERIAPPERIRHDWTQVLWSVVSVSMQRWFGTGSIEDSQKDSAKLMAQRLAGENP